MLTLGGPKSERAMKARETNKNMNRRFIREDAANFTI